MRKDTSYTSSPELELATRRGFEPPIASATPEPGDSDNRSLLIADLAGIDQAIASPRECDCPEWVIRCAHIDDLVIAVGDAVLFRMQEEFFHIGKRYALIDPRRAVNTRDAVGYLYTDAPGLHQTFDSEAEALAAFRAAEAELLGRAL